MRNKSYLIKLTALCILLSAFCILPSAFSQTTNGPVVTNATTATITFPTFLGEVWDTLVGQGLTNLSETTYATYTPSIKKWGLGEVITRNLPLGGGVSTGVGIGVDYYDSNLYALNGQVSLSAALTPFSNWGSWGKKIIITPLTFVGIGTPFGNSGNSGTIETILAAGAGIHIAHVLGADLDLVGVYGHRTGLDKASGAFYGGGPTLIWRF